MATTSRDELLKTDFLKLADPNTGKISKVIAPNALQVGLDDEQFRSSLTVKGSTTVERSLVVQQGITGSLTQVSDGVDFIQAGSNVTVTKNSNGSLTIAASASVERLARDCFFSRRCSGKGNNMLIGRVRSNS